MGGSSTSSQLVSREGGQLIESHHEAQTVVTWRSWSLWIDNVWWITTLVCARATVNTSTNKG